MIHKLVNRYSYKKMKWLMIGLTALFAVLFIVSLVFAILTQIELNSYTTLTM